MRQKSEEKGDNSTPTFVLVSVPKNQKLEHGNRRFGNPEVVNIHNFLALRQTLWHLEIMATMKFGQKRSL
jgi:hypothetical protein